MNSNDASGPVPLTPGTAADLTTLALELEELPDEEVRSGTPRAGYRDLEAGEGLSLGVWQMTRGTAVDVEEDECFIVLSGRATVTISPETEGGEVSTLELVPGVIGRLSAGMHTEWIVHEDLRKVYLLPVT